MKKSIPAALSLFALIAAAPSVASVVYGNPNVEITLDSGSAVQVDRVQASTCPGSQVVSIYDTVTTTNPIDVTLPEDDWCALTLKVKWAGSSVWEQVPVDGFTTFSTEAGETDRAIVLDPVSETATLE